MEKTKPEMRTVLEEMVKLGLHKPFVRAANNPANNTPPGDAVSTSIPASEPVALAVEAAAEAVAVEGVSVEGVGEAAATAAAAAAAAAANNHHAAVLFTPPPKSKEASVVAN
jgi:hypothetical protein